MEQVLSSRFGLGHSLKRMPRQAGEPRVHIFGVEPALLGPLFTAPARQSCGGAGLSSQEAKLSALGELIEGYCTASPRPAEFIFGTARELRRHHEVVEPERFALFSERQHARPGFPFARFTEETPLSWVWGYSLIRQKHLLVPACRVYMPPVRRQGEANIGPTISTGLAAGPSLKHAIVSGLHECFERDAFSIFWMNDLPPRRIALPSSSDETRVGKLFREHFVTPGYEYRAYDIGNDLGVPTAYVLLTCATSHGTIYVVGAAARLDRGQATLKALLEAVQGKSYVQWLMSQHTGWSPTADFSNVTDFCFSCIVYSVARELTPHLLGVEQRVSSELSLKELPRASPGDATTELRELVLRLAVRDYEAIVVELTTPDVAPLGVRVVRVITPELQPLHADHRFPFLGGRRLYEVPALLGHGDVRTEDQLSPYPHPFP